MAEVAQTYPAGTAPGRTAPVRAGDALDDRYLLVRLLAAGGMGEVWEATDLRLGRQVAVKVTSPAPHADGAPAAASPGETAGTAARRFRDEALLLSQLSHGNVARVYDYADAEHTGGSPYLVMELVPGCDLDQVLQRYGALSPEHVTSIVAQVALGLAAAHRAGVVHRDVKPANLMVTPEGTVKITDFGIATSRASSALTRAGDVIGTPYYLSPEQAQGRPATAASDLYALGVVAHELLTGVRPFERDTPVATALAHILEAPPALPDGLPVALREVIGACLAKDPADRPASARVVAEWLTGPDRPAATDNGSPFGDLTTRDRTTETGAAPMSRTGGRARHRAEEPAPTWWRRLTGAGTA